MFTECAGCNQLTVNPQDPPRYDVLAENITGPYCSECWPNTYTGSQPNEQVPNPEGP